MPLELHSLSRKFIDCEGPSLEVVAIPGYNTSSQRLTSCKPQPIVLLVRSITFTKFCEGLGKGCTSLTYIGCRLKHAKTMGLGAILFFGLLFGTHQHVDRYVYFAVYTAPSNTLLQVRKSVSTG